MGNDWAICGTPKFPSAVLCGAELDYKGRWMDVYVITLSSDGDCVQFEHTHNGVRVGQKWYTATDMQDAIAQAEKIIEGGF